MELENTFVVPADLDTAWATLLDVEAITPCMPGATLTSFEGDHFTADVKVKLGPVLMTFAGEGDFESINAAEHIAVIKASGKEKKGAGTASAHITARLVAETPDTTRAMITTELLVTGKAAQFGRGVMADVSKHLISQFAGNLEKVMMARQGSASAVVEPGASSAEAAAVGVSPTAPVLNNEALNLGNAALKPVLKRLIPAVLVVVAAVGVIWWLVAR